MLAGRKLLLADDSITIQKVVELTFADEGVTVVSVGTGNEAVERLEELAPDIVLADVCMPALNGYELCEYIKQDASLKHIPVMLLVGSFEPFDEAEARRVGADDTLTKPFQSIRRLIDKVGELVSGKKDNDQIPTAELPHVEAEPAEPVTLSPEELEITTANTQPLPMASSSASALIAEPAKASADFSAAKDEVAVESSWKELNMESTNSQMPIEAVIEQGTDLPGDELLELGDLGSGLEASPEEFVLDIDLNEPVDQSEYAYAPAAPAWSAPRAHAFVEPEVSAPRVVDWHVESKAPNGGSTKNTSELVNAGQGFSHAGETSATTSQLDDTQEWRREAPSSSASSASQGADSSANQTRWERVVDEPSESVQPATPAGNISADQLSPEMIDAIARRAVEYLSEKVVREIAWEVVPELAELMIKRRLEEKESQHK